MEQKHMKVGEHRNGVMVDTTAETLEQLKYRIEKLDKLLTAYGKAE